MEFELGNEIANSANAIGVGEQSNYALDSIIV
jgi:hypothetical protein